MYEQTMKALALSIESMHADKVRLINDVAELKRQLYNSQCETARGNEEAKRLNEMCEVRAKERDQIKASKDLLVRELHRTREQRDDALMALTKLKTRYYAKKKR